MHKFYIKYFLIVFLFNGLFMSLVMSGYDYFKEGAFVLSDVLVWFFGYGTVVSAFHTALLKYSFDTLGLDRPEKSSVERLILQELSGSKTPQILINELSKHSKFKKIQLLWQEPFIILKPKGSLKFWGDEIHLEVEVKDEGTYIYQPSVPDMAAKSIFRNLKNLKNINSIKRLIEA